MTKCHFNRNLKIAQVDMSKAQNMLDFSNNRELHSEKFFVTLSARFTQKIDEEVFIEAEISYIGGFKRGNNVSEETLQSFCNINAPAILFPYIRETLSNLSVKAGLQPILIQPINFVELSKQVIDK